MRDLIDIKHVYDVSLPGSGCQHIFNSIVNEIERNPEINASDTMVMVMWSGLSRTDIIAETPMVERWVHTTLPKDRDADHSTDGVYRFDQKFSTFSMQYQDGWKKGNDPVTRMQHSYRLVIGWDAQVLQSLLNIVALAGYLESKGFAWMFMSWKDPQPDLDIVPGELSQRVGRLMQTVLPLGDYALEQQELDGTLHPTPAANLAWTEKHLIPTLDKLGLTHALG